MYFQKTLSIILGIEEVLDISLEIHPFEIYK